VVKEIHAAGPRAGILVIDDGSSDGTAEAAREAGAHVVTNPFNLGVGGAMRVGFRFAADHGFDAVVQVDADGQHDPRDIARLLEALDESPAPAVVIGARFMGMGELRVPKARRAAMRILAVYLTKVTRTTLSDVTSGFRAHNRAAVTLFARVYPAEYLADTVESLVLLTRAGGRVSQVPVAMRARYAGTPSQSSWRAITYLLRVVVMLAVNVVRHQPAPQDRRHQSQEVSS
jgi:glycosyltransferase involved in cell wall biosynthesis